MQSLHSQCSVWDPKTNHALGSIRNGTEQDLQCVCLDAKANHPEMLLAGGQRGARTGDNIEVSCNEEEGGVANIIALLHTPWRSAALTPVNWAEEKVSNRGGIFSTGPWERNEVDHHHLPLPAAFHVKFDMVRAPGPCVLPCPGERLV